MNKAAKASHVLIMGDYNCREINWNELEIEGPESRFANAFYEATEDAYLVQHVKETIRYREGNKATCLDLVFTNEENMIDKVTTSAPLGSSDHLCLEWNYI